MNTVLLLINQDHLLLEKSGCWGYGNDLKALYRTPHRDEAINQKVELTVKSPELRLQIVEAPLDERGFPVLAPEILEKIPPRLQQQPQSESVPSTEDNAPAANEDGIASDTAKASLG